MLRQWERKLYSVYAKSMIKDVGKQKNKWTLKIWEKFVDDAQVSDVAVISSSVGGMGGLVGASCVGW